MKSGARVRVTGQPRSIARDFGSGKPHRDEIAAIGTEWWSSKAGPARVDEPRERAARTFERFKIIEGSPSFSTAILPRRSICRSAARRSSRRPCSSRTSGLAYSADVRRPCAHRRGCPVGEFRGSRKGESPAIGPASSSSTPIRS